MTHRNVFFDLKKNCLRSKIFNKLFVKFLPVIYLNRRRNSLNQTNLYIKTRSEKIFFDLEKKLSSFKNHSQKSFFFYLKKNCFRSKIFNKLFLKFLPVMYLNRKKIL